MKFSKKQLELIKAAIGIARYATYKSYCYAFTGAATAPSNNYKNTLTEQAKAKEKEFKDYQKLEQIFDSTFWRENNTFWRENNTDYILTLTRVKKGKK